MNSLSNKAFATKVIAHIGGTNPISSSINDYFNSSIPISYSKTNPKFIITFKSNIYVELKSVLITNKQTNVREYKIDLMDSDRTTLQTININTQHKPSDVKFHVPIAALQITYLTTIDGQTPRNITLSIDGCFGTYPFSSTTADTSIKTTSSPSILTTRKKILVFLFNPLRPDVDYR